MRIIVIMRPLLIGIVKHPFAEMISEFEATTKDIFTARATSALSKVFKARQIILTDIHNLNIQNQ